MMFLGDFVVPTVQKATSVLLLCKSVRSKFDLISSKTCKKVRVIIVEIIWLCAYVKSMVFGKLINMRS